MACHGSHFWARELTSLGHTVRLLPTQYVKPILVGGKNDANDASAICATVSGPGIHPVPIKSARTGVSVILMPFTGLEPSRGDKA